MNDIKKLIRDIDRGADLERNLPVYANLLCDTYLNYAAMELTFSTWLLTETTADDRMICEEERKRYTEVLAQLQKVLPEKTETLPETIREGKNLREQITQVMEVYTSYTDRLLCYEYVLKRMDLKFMGEDDVPAELLTVKEDDFVARLMAFLAGNKDRSVTKERLQKMMGLVPIHMTKGKFLDRIRESLSLYQGSDEASLEGFVYRIRSVAMLHRPEESVVSDREIRNFLERMDQTEFSSMDKPEYERAFTELQSLSEKMLHITDFYSALQKVINGVLALAIVRLHNPKQSEIFETCRTVLASLAEGEWKEDELVKLEGRIEHYVERSSYLEAVLFQTKDSCRDTLEKLGLTEAFEDYAAVANLLSDSLFIDLSQEDEAAGKTVGEEEVRQAAAELTKELSDLLGSLKRPVKKAVMAAVLEVLPVPFTRVDEIETYIRTNLFGCQDFSERGAVLLELEELMNEEAEWRKQ